MSDTEKTMIESFEAFKRTARMEQVLSLVRIEREKQDQKWGQQDHRDLKWLAILTEEVGEVAKEILDSGDGSIDLDRAVELIQVAAVAVAWVEALERRHS